MTNEEIIQRGQLINDETEPAQNTSERVGGVIKGIGQNLADKDTAIEAQAARNGYYQCTVSDTTLAVTAPGFTLPAHGGNIRIKMSAPGTGASTLNINSTGAKALLYNGAAVSSANTWERDEIISVFYDPSGSGQYLASNSQGGGGKFSTGEKVGNVGIDNVPTKNSENIVKSGGVYATTPSISGGESELDIRDEESNILAQFYEGNFRTQKFDSAEAMVTGKTPVTLDIVDDNGRVIARFENGHIKTRNFDSSNFASLFHSNLYQKKMCIIGDSYVANHNQSYTLTWHYKIAQENEMVYVNYGINGNGLVASGSPTIGTPVIDRYSEMDDDADYVIVVGGKNDYNKQLSIASFKTGLASICAGLIDKYVARGSKIAFFTPWNDYDSGTDPSSIKLIEYVDAIIEVCGKYSIPVFDSSRKSSMFMFNATFRTNYCQSSTDISHLNANGHNLFKNKAFNFLNQL